MRSAATAKSAAAAYARTIPVSVKIGCRGHYGRGRQLGHGSAGGRAMVASDASEQGCERLTAADAHRDNARFEIPTNEILRDA